MDGQLLPGEAEAGLAAPTSPEDAWTSSGRGSGSAYVQGAEEWTRENVGRPMTADELDGVVARSPSQPNPSRDWNVDTSSWCSDAGTAPAALCWVFDERATSADLLLALRDATRAAELAERLADVASKAVERAEAAALGSEEIAAMADQAASAATKTAERARAAATQARTLASRDALATAQSEAAAARSAESAARDSYQHAEAEPRRR